jgi:hypothetical protein
MKQQYLNNNNHGSNHGNNHNGNSNSIKKHKTLLSTSSP